MSEPATLPTGNHRAADADGAGMEQRQLEAALRRVVADEIAEHRRQARANGGPWLGPLDERQMARAILHRELDLRAREALRLGEPASGWTWLMRSWARCSRHCLAWSSTLAGRMPSMSTSRAAAS